VLHLSVDKTRKEKRGRKHPLGYVSRESEHAPYTFGFDMVILIASWDRYRFPIAIAPIDLESKGHQNLLFRSMLKTFTPPSWVCQVVVSADAGFAANKTLQLIDDRNWTYVFTMHRTRKFTNDKSLRDLVRHLPKSCYHRRASFKPDGRRRDYWLLRHRATLTHLGDVTIVLSKKRRNDGPKQVKLFVTNLTEARAGAILSEYAWRWAVELVIKEWQRKLRQYKQVA
jgi:Transposase DDE domain group 1